MSDVYGSTYSQCGPSVEDHFNFCVTCGARVTRHTPTDPVVPSQSTADTSNVPSNEKRLIENYFYSGYEYNVIVHLLGKFHGIFISLSTLKRQMKIYRLRRNSGTTYNGNYVRGVISRKLNGPGCMGGYRSMWRIAHGITVPRNEVQKLMKELDPEGCAPQTSQKTPKKTAKA